MKVCIDDVLAVDCVGLLNGGDTWNGYAEPIFNAEQVATIHQWWNDNNGDNWNGTTFDENITDLGNGEFVFYGWAWTIDR